ncbi:MAG: PAS domain S-box protein [Thermoplasmata archaeon]|nr:PAS domain S-box protein [Thermoplasmata archaeon]
MAKHQAGEDAGPTNDADGRFKTMFQKASDGMAFLSKSGEILEANEKAVEMCGGRGGELVGRNYLDLGLVSPENEGQFHENFKATLAGKSSVIELRTKSQKGEELDLECTARLVGSGDQAGVMIIARDVTYRKKSENALRNSEERLSSFMNSATEGFAIFDSELNVINVNKVLLELFPEFNRENVIGKNLKELIPETLESGRFDKFIEVMRKGEPLYEDDLIPHERFGNVHVSIRAFPVGGGLGLIVNDVTQKKKVEAALRESEQKFRILAEESPNMIFINSGSRVVYANKKCIEVMGYSLEEFHSPHFDFRCLFAPESLDLMNETWTKHSKNRDVEPLEYAILTKSGDRVETIVATKLIFYEGETAILGIVTDISDRKNAEILIRQQNEQLNSVMESVTHPFYVIDAETFRIEMANSATFEGELTENETCYRLIHSREQPCEGEGHICPVKEVKRTKGPVTVQHEHLDKDGKFKSVEVHAHPIFDANGNVVRIVEYGFDVTERREAEEALKQSEEKYRSLVERAGAGIAKSDMEGRFTFVNQELCRLFGYSEDELIGEPFVNFIHPDDQGFVLEAFMGAFEDPDDEKSFEFRVTHKDGQILHLYSKPTVTIHDGQIVGSDAIISDITERKLAEEASQENEARRIEAQQMADLGDWEWDLATDTVTLSDQMYKIVGLEKDKDKITPSIEIFAEIVHPDDQWIFSQSSFEDSFQTGVIGTEYRIIDQTTGDIKHIHVRGRVDLDANEEPVRIRGTFQDITERKKAEEILSKRTYDLGERYKELNCLYTISKLAEVSDLSMDELLQGVVDIIPPSWQYPEVTCATIELEDWDISVGTPSEAVSSMSSDIFVDERKVGKVTVSYTENKPPKDEGPFFSEERDLIDAIAEEVGRIREQRRSQQELKRLEWLLLPRDVSDVPLEPTYGNLTQINTSKLILDSVGKDILTDISSDYLGLLESSGAIYESNGDYALGIFSSNWCRFLDNASRELCKTEDNKEALECGKWLCHESCWNDASKPSIETGLPTDVECNGGIQLYAVPIHAGGKVVGSINFGYGDPPTDPEKLQEIADKYDVSVEKLHELAASYESRPRFIIDMAKSRLQAQAGLIGEIIERKQTEDELRRSEERFKIMFDYAPDAFVLTDQEGVFIDGNSASEELLGFTKDDAIGNNLLDLGAIPEDQIERTMENLLKTIEGHSTGPDEVELVSKKGEKVIVETRTYPVRIDGQDMMLATARDITEWKRIEGAKQNLLSNISHELRTPLTSIEGYTKFMLSGKLGEVPEKQEKCLYVIDEESGRLKTLIDNFLDLMTIDAEGLRMKLRQIAVPDVIDSLVSTLNLQLEMKGISFSTDIGPDIGLIWGDENRLHQLFSNLVSNAIKFTPHGGSIMVRSREEDSNIIIEVEDTGVGISAKELPHVFSRFYQVDGSPSRKFGGVGLGLAICNEIVEAHGGHIEVESEVDKGTIFRVELPKYSEVLHGEKEDSGG